MKSLRPALLAFFLSIKNTKKKPITGDGQRLHTAILHFTQGKKVV
jgi:hypothetical protein